MANPNVFSQQEFQIEADYYAIYLGDHLSFLDEDIANSPFDFERMLDVVSTKLIRFYTASRMTVSVVVDQLHDRPSDIPASSWDLISEISVCCPSKRLSIEGTTGYWPEAKTFAVEYSDLRIRVHSANMTVPDTDADHYLLQIWPEEYSEARLLYRNNLYLNHYQK